MNDPANAQSGDGDDYLNFAWMVLVMMDIGYAEKEVGHMYFGKWQDLFFEWKKLHNMRMERLVFKGTEEVHSLMDI